MAHSSNSSSNSSSSPTPSTSSISSDSAGSFSTSKSDVWQYFTKKVDADGITHGICHSCKKSFKCLYGTTSSLRNQSLNSVHLSFKQKLPGMLLVVVVISNHYIQDA